MLDIPFVSYGGENDPQLQASENVIKALKEVGIDFKTDGLETTRSASP